MDYTTRSLKDRQAQDLAEHGRGCGIGLLFFVALAIIVSLCGLIDGNIEVGLILGGIILLIGGVILGFSFKEYLRKLKDFKK